MYIIFPHGLRQTFSRFTGCIAIAIGTLILGTIGCSSSPAATNASSQSSAESDPSYGSVGAACDVTGNGNLLCQSGLACSPNTATCVPNTSPIGGECDGVKITCGEGRCDLKTNRCIPIPGAVKQCSQCPAGWHCDTDREYGAATVACAPPPAPTVLGTAGDACGSIDANTGYSLECQSGLQCDAGGHCRFIGEVACSGECPAGTVCVDNPSQYGGRFISCEEAGPRTVAGTIGDTCDTIDPAYGVERTCGFEQTCEASTAGAAKTCNWLY